MDDIASWPVLKVKVARAGDMDCCNCKAESPIVVGTALLETSYCLLQVFTLAVKPNFGVAE
jgi:hypothetical protein